MAWLTSASGKTIFTCELILPLYAEENWNEKLFKSETKENKKLSSKEYALLFIEASVAEKEQRYDDLLNIRKDILRNIKKDFGENSEFTGFAHLSIASNYKLLGKFKNAEFHYKKSLEIFSNKKINNPTMVHFGKLDTGIPEEKVQKVKSFSKNQEHDLIVHEYDNADHGFNCEDRKSYNQKSANLALEKSLQFIDKSYD